MPINLYNFSPFTYYVQERDYSVEEVLKIINQDDGVHHVLSAGSGHFYSAGTAYETFTGIAYSLAALFKFISIFIPPSNENASQASSYNYDLDTYISPYTQRYSEREVTDSLYKGKEIVTLINKLNEAYLDMSKHEIVLQFLNHEFINEDFVPTVKDAGYLWNYSPPSAVLVSADSHTVETTGHDL